MISAINSAFHSFELPVFQFQRRGAAEDGDDDADDAFVGEDFVDGTL